MGEIYFGRGNEELYDDYFDFINYVFGFNGNAGDFKKLLPKIYKPEDKPVENSYIALDNGKIKAAVGVYPHELDVCGVRLVCRGIGNVSVHPYSRSKGYMKKLMNMALDDMAEGGVDISVLGGRRQRYNYFSFEKTGIVYRFTVNNDNMRHNYGEDRTAHHIFELRKIQSDDREILTSVSDLLKSDKYDPCRPIDNLYNILVSWKYTPYVFLKDGRFAGYVITDAKTVSEILLADEADFMDAIVSLYDFLGCPSISICLPAFRTGYIRALYRFCEGYDISTDMCFSVLNYMRVIEAFTRLKATYTPLPEGEITMLIHGRAGDENIKIAVKQQEISVLEHTGACDVELEHIDAMNMLFSPFCPGRDALSDFAKLLLPLPLWLYHTDAV